MWGMCTLETLWIFLESIGPSQPIHIDARPLCFFLQRKVQKFLRLPANILRLLFQSSCARMLPARCEVHLLFVWCAGCSTFFSFVSGAGVVVGAQAIIGMKTWLSLKMGLNSDGFSWITTVDHHFRPPASGRRSSHSARYLLTHLDHVTNPIEAQIWEGVVAPGLVLVASCLELS